MTTLALHKLVLSLLVISVAIDELIAVGTEVHAARVKAEFLGGNLIKFQRTDSKA